MLKSSVALLFVLITVTKSESEKVELGTFYNLDKFYDFYANITGKTNVTLNILRTNYAHECCVCMNKTYCSSYNLSITVCCKNIESIDIKCSDIISIEYIIYYRGENRPILNMDQISALIFASIVLIIIIVAIIITFCIKRTDR